MCLASDRKPCHSYCPGAQGGQAGIEAGRPDGQQAARVHRDVLVVDVERVEGLRSLRRRLEEGARAAHLPVGEPAEEDLIEDVLAVARTLGRDRHLLPVDRGVPLHRPVHRGQEPDRISVERSRVEVPHRPALPVVEVPLVAALTEPFDVLVDDVAARRRERGREVLTASDQHVAGERRRGRATPLQSRGVHVDLVGEAGIEVADLRAADHQRVPGRRAIRVDHQGVAGLGRIGGLLRRRGLGGRRGVVAPGIQDHAALGVLGNLPVVEGAVDRGRALGVLELAEVVEDALAPVRPEPLPQPAEELRAASLVAAALAHELPLEGVERVDVVTRPRERSGSCSPRGGR